VHSSRSKIVLDFQEGTERQRLDKKNGLQWIAPSRWLDKHRPVDQVTWAPGEPEEIKDSSGRPITRFLSST